MKISLIGASGFIGTHLTTRIKDSHDLINMDKKNSNFYPELTIVGDIRNFDEIVDPIKGSEMVVLLAAEHKDNVKPSSLYYDVNVEGTRNVLRAMDSNGITRIIFTSSVAVYGFNKPDPGEDHIIAPENHYGKSKWLAEEILKEWYLEDVNNRSLTIIRPTVVFGERNRGNVYNLLNQMITGRYIMIGNGRNKKSMAYVGNLVEFINHIIDRNLTGYNLFNFVDKPDFSMNELDRLVKSILGLKKSSISIPYPIGMLGGYLFDLLSKITGKEYAVSSVRIKKFCATTMFHSDNIEDSGFKAPFTLEAGLSRTISFEFQ